MKFNALVGVRPWAIVVVAALAAFSGGVGAVHGQSCIPAPAGLTHWWPGDGAADALVGAQSATLQGGATFGAGLVGQAFQLDGVNDYVEVPHHSSFDVGTADFTVDLWARFNNTSGEQVLIEHWIDGVSGWTLTKLGGNQIHFATMGGSPTSSSVSIPNATWIHFAVRRSGTTAAVFMNGSQIASGSVGSNFSSTSSLKFGRRGDPRGFFLNGRIDEVHLFVGRALPNGEIQSIFNAGSGGLCPGAVCGDGVPGGTEECDDGNMVAGDGCENDCTLSCGNNVTDPGEQCDDGNTVNGDGCDNDCTTSVCGNGQTGGPEECDDGNLVDEDACKNDCTDNVCGDGATHTGVEECDDGGLLDDDGCDSNCTVTGCGNSIVTSGEACDDGNAVDEDPCKNDCSANVCNDGALNPGVEACDDGNGTNGDGCDTDCSVSCGNGVTSPPETCDDGDLDDGDGCDSNCTSTACGNGIQTASNGEVCDDGNLDDGDACKSDCTANVCGDGAVFAGPETCDDGNLLDGDGCDSDCTVSGPCAPPPVDLTSWWIADGSGADIQGGHDAVARHGATFGVGRVRQAFLLDGSDDFFEVADGPAIDVTTGDFTIDLWVNFDNTTGEQVLVEKWVESFNSTSGGWTLTKLSNNELLLATAAGDAHSDRLTLAPNTWIHFAARRRAGALAIFMNGNQVGEDESVGDLSSPSSLKFGHRGGPLDTPGSLDTRGFHLRGRIDEAHWVNGRGLDDSEIQAIVAAGRSGFCVPIPVCGNALVEAGEACDDGNPVDGDGCETDCQLSCGNMTTDAGEGCDDGNNVSGDGCDTNCTVSACGNEIAAGMEECEDGNSTNGDGCDNNCTLTECGNGVPTTSNGEACDDGNAVDGDGCEGDCTVTPVEETALPGGTVTTDPFGQGATPALPMQASVKTPDGGLVSMGTSSAPPSTTNALRLIEDLLIEAPPATASNPLTVVLRVDTSLIPAVYLLQMVLIRNGVVVANCTGPEGVAAPDPCIKGRGLLPDGDVEITGLTSHASLWGIAVRGLDRVERKCANGVAKIGTGVIKAQDKVSAACLKSAILGTEPDAQACLQADSSGKVATSILKTTDFASARCVPAPPFGFVGANDTNVAARGAALALVADLFGANLTSSIAGDEAGGKCQRAALKEVQKLFSLHNAQFLKCMAAGLVGDTTLVVTADQLESCHDALALDEKLLKGASKLGKTVAKQCGGQTASLLPGICGGARNVAYCLKTRVGCRSCQMFNSALGLGRDCDLLDDLIDNGSCS